MGIEDHSHDHYHLNRCLDEYPNLSEAKPVYRNVGWSLGNRCPLKCRQCYSKSAREAGMDLSCELIDRVIDQLSGLRVHTVNLGGNEPIYTNGLNPKHSKLPYILSSLTERGIKVGITSAGPTITMLNRHFPESLKLINDVDISLDSPVASEHDQNRGQKGIYRLAMNALDIVEKMGIPRSLIMCAMNWNFTPDRIGAFIDLARAHDANVRFNPIKPVEREHMALTLSPTQFFDGLKIVTEKCDTVDLSDPAWAVAGSVNKDRVSGCPCGVNSFRIHSITPDGQLPISPCVYLHDYKSGDLATQEIGEILQSSPFREFRRRKGNPDMIRGCEGCSDLDVCGGGCASRAYLHSMHTDDSQRSIFIKDPYCPKDNLPECDSVNPVTFTEQEDLVHMGYLCTGIFKPR